MFLFSGYPNKKTHILHSYMNISYMKYSNWNMKAISSSSHMNTYLRFLLVCEIFKFFCLSYFQTALNQITIIFEIAQIGRKFHWKNFFFSGIIPSWDVTTWLIPWEPLISQKLLTIQWLYQQMIVQWKKANWTHLESIEIIFLDVPVLKINYYLWVSKFIFKLWERNYLELDSIFKINVVHKN